MPTILRVHAKRTEGNGVTHYEYPPEYDAEKIQVLAYEEGGECALRNDGHQHLIGIVADADAAQFLASPDIEEIDEATACEAGERWRPQVQRISDQNVVLTIVAKAAIGGKLTIAEKDALNPDTATPGVSKSVSFTTLLGEAKNADRYK